MSECPQQLAPIDLESYEFDFDNITSEFFFYLKAYIKNSCNNEEKGMMFNNFMKENDVLNRIYNHYMKIVFNPIYIRNVTQKREVIQFVEMKTIQLRDKIIREKLNENERIKEEENMLIEINSLGDDYSLYYTQ